MAHNQFPFRRDSHPDLTRAIHRVVESASGQGKYPRPSASGGVRAGEGNPPRPAKPQYRYPGGVVHTRYATKGVLKKVKEAREHNRFLESVLEELCEELHLDPQELREDPTTLQSMYDTMLYSGGAGHAIQGGLPATILLISFIASAVGAFAMDMPGLRALPKQALVGLLGKLKRFIVKVKSGKKLTPDEKAQARDILASASKRKGTES